MQTYKQFTQNPKSKKICKDLCIESELDYIAWQYETKAIYNEGEETALDLAAQLGLEINELEDIIL